MKLEKLASTCVFYILIVCIFLSLTYLCSEATDTVAEMIPVEREHTVVIDAGHGGEDGGAISCTGKPESGYNLEIALKLRDLMELLGYETRMIRETDVSVYTEGDTLARKKVSDLQQRVKIINETEDAVLVSIHQNTFSDSRYSGPQVFYGPAGESQALADQMQQALVSSLTPGSSRKCKPAENVYLMQNIRCTGILVECGFLSNPWEEALLRDEAYRKKLCCVIASQLALYLDQ